MWIFVAIGALLTWVGFELSHKQSVPPPNISTPGRLPTYSSGALAHRPSAVQMLSVCIERGIEFPMDLVDAAKCECQRNGDQETLAALMQAFPPTIAHREQSPTPAPAPAPAQYASPIYGVSDDEWSAFIASLATQAPSYRDDNHVGAYHHNTKRLADLGIDPSSLTSDAAQYAAIEQDLKDTLNRHAKLINEFAGDVITINGQQAPVTRSGILALIKSAGASGARSWLSSDDERTRYPNTTMVFLRCNGIF